MMSLFSNLSKLHHLGGKHEREELNLEGLVRIYKVFGRHYKKYWKILTVAYLSLFAAIGVTVLAPWPLKLILDHLILKQPLPEIFSFLNPLYTGNPKLLLLLLALSIIVIAFLEATFSYFNKFWISATGDRMNADIRERVFSHLQRLSLSFHESAQSGNLIYLLTADVKEMKKVLVDFPQDLTNRVVSFAVYAGLMLALDWRLGLAGLCTMPLIYFFTKYFGGGMRTAITKKRKQEGKVASIIAENVTAMALVQAYGREETERARFSLGNQESLKAQLRALSLSRTFARIVEFLVALSAAGVLYLGGRYALAGGLLPGTLVVFMAYMRDIYGIFEKFSELFLGMAKSQVSGERLLELVENDMVVQDDPDAVPAPPFQGRVEFKNVSFAYKKGREVLKNLNFIVEPGETVALVGHSGAGKSTLISLLLRFYDPQQGQILVDGRDLRTFTLKSLRGQMTIVLQDAKLFRQTVRENIAFGKTGATEDETIAAAKLAKAHDFITRMPEGYDTMIYEGGDNLSGGQKQRINIARAMIRNTPLMILDEPVTGLDARAEAQINAAIHRLTRGKTTFIIAHKFSTIAAAERILLLEDGQVAHYGVHEQLMRECPHYRELYELQFGRQREPAASEAASGGENGEIATQDVATFVVTPSSDGRSETITPEVATMSPRETGTL
jgi:ATP-binding cassette subfamily B protein